MKRILFVIPTLDRAGAEKQLVLLANGLPREQFDVHVAVLTRTGPLADELNAPITFIGKRWKYDPFALGRLKKLMREFKPDIVHTWLFAGNSYGRKAAFDCGVPCVFAGERCVDSWKSRFQFWVDKKLAAKTNKIITNSNGVVDFYAKHGFDANKFAVIPNGVEKPKASTLTKAQILSRLGLSQDVLANNAEKSRTLYIRANKASNEPLYSSCYEISELKVGKPATTGVCSTGGAAVHTDFGIGPYFIGIVARLWPQKRLKEAIWTTDVLKYINVDFHLLIIGDGPERESLLRYRDTLHLADRVHFLGARNDVADLMPHFDLLWNTSAYEGQSNSILEAMSNGIPVIATNISGNRDLVVNNETGFLVPDGHTLSSSLAERTVQLLESTQKRKDFGAAAKKRVAELFGVDKMIDKHVQLYEK